METGLQMWPVNYQAQDRESSPVKDQRSTTVLRRQLSHFLSLSLELFLRPRLHFRYYWQPLQTVCSWITLWICTLAALLIAVNSSEEKTSSDSEGIVSTLCGYVAPALVVVIYFLFIFLVLEYF